MYGCLGFKFSERLTSIPFCCRFPMQDMKGHMMDIRTADGGVVKITADQDVAKTLLNADMVQSMYKVRYSFFF